MRELLARFILVAGGCTERRHSECQKTSSPGCSTESDDVAPEQFAESKFECESRRHTDYEGNCERPESGGTGEDFAVLEPEETRIRESIGEEEDNRVLAIDIHPNEGGGERQSETIKTDKFP